jgi:hypothetical protein
MALNHDLTAMHSHGNLFLEFFRETQNPLFPTEEARKRVEFAKPTKFVGKRLVAASLFLFVRADYSGIIPVVCLFVLSLIMQVCFILGDTDHNNHRLAVVFNNDGFATYSDIVNDLTGISM